MKKLYVAAAVVFLLLSSVFLGACGTPTTSDEADQTTTEATSTESSAPASEAAPEKLAIGDSGTTADYKVTLNEVTKLDNTDFDKPSDDANMFVAVDVTVENTGAKDTAFSSAMEFSLKDSEGYTATQTFHSKSQAIPEGSLAVDSKASGQIVYEVPKDATGLELVFDASILGGGQLTWSIGDAADL